MNDYNIIGIDLAKRNFHIAAISADRKLVLSKAINREDFFQKFLPKLPAQQTFAFEACGALCSSSHREIRA